MNFHVSLPAKQKRSAETIEIILEAVRIQLRAGEQLIMQAIADKAGVSIGTVYHHFASKDHILAFAYTRYLESIVDTLKKEIVDDRRSAREVIREVFMMNLRDVDHYYNIRYYMLDDGHSSVMVWNDFVDRVSELLLDNSPGMFVGMDRICAKNTLAIRFASVRTMWQKHMQIITDASDASDAYYAAFVDTLVGLMSE